MCRKKLIQSPIMQTLLIQAYYNDINKYLYRRAKFIHIRGSQRYGKFCVSDHNLIKIKKISRSTFYRQPSSERATITMLNVLSDFIRERTIKKQDLSLTERGIGNENQK